MPQTTLQEPAVPAGARAAGTAGEELRAGLDVEQPWQLPAQPPETGAAVPGQPSREAFPDLLAEPSGFSSGQQQAQHRRHQEQAACPTDSSSSHRRRQQQQQQHSQPQEQAACPTHSSSGHRQQQQQQLRKDGEQSSPRADAGEARFPVPNVPAWQAAWQVQAASEALGSRPSTGGESPEAVQPAENTPSQAQGCQTGDHALGLGV